MLLILLMRCESSCGTYKNRGGYIRGKHQAKIFSLMKTCCFLSIQMDSTVLPFSPKNAPPGEGPTYTSMCYVTKIYIVSVTRQRKIHICIIYFPVFSNAYFSDAFSLPLGPNQFFFPVRNCFVVLQLAMTTDYHSILWEKKV